MDEFNQKEATSFAPWAIIVFLFCCGGPIILLALLSGGAAGILGFFSSSIFLISVGILASLLATLWFIAKFKTKN